MPAQIMSAACVGGAAATPGRTRMRTPVAASIQPTPTRMSIRSPPSTPAKIMASCTAPNSSNAPVPAVIATYAKREGHGVDDQCQADPQSPP